MSFSCGALRRRLDAVARGGPGRPPMSPQRARRRRGAREVARRAPRRRRVVGVRRARAPIVCGSIAAFVGPCAAAGQRARASGTGRGAGAGRPGRSCSRTAARRARGRRGRARRRRPRTPPPSAGPPRAPARTGTGEAFTVTAPSTAWASRSPRSRRARRAAAEADSSG